MFRNFIREHKAVAPEERWFSMFPFFHCLDFRRWMCQTRTICRGIKFEEQETYEVETKNLVTNTAVMNKP